jgi:hypothetical protein
MKADKAGTKADKAGAETDEAGSEAWAEADEAGSAVDDAILTWRCRMPMPGRRGPGAGMSPGFTGSAPEPALSRRGAWRRSPSVSPDACLSHQVSPGSAGCWRRPSRTRRRRCRRFPPEACRMPAPSRRGVGHWSSRARRRRSGWACNSMDAAPSHAPGWAESDPAWRRSQSAPSLRSWRSCRRG